MRISLLHNPEAGAGVTFETLRDMIVHAGHDIVQVLDPDDELPGALAPTAELLALAGGDGTVARAARALAGHRVPIAIVPLGTANNIAGSLGITGIPSAVIARWATTRPVPVDLGVARGAWGEQRFVESVGIGLIPTAITSADAAERSAAEPDTLAAARMYRGMRAVRDKLRHLVPRPVTLTLDGRSTHGDYLLVEVLNTHLIGPNLELAADADPRDGFLHVVVAAAEHRAALDDYLARAIEGETCRLALPVWRARSVELAGWPSVHLDDQVHDEPSAEVVAAWIEPGAVQMIAGALA